MEDCKQDIYQSIENIGLMKTIEMFFGVGTIIELPFSEKAFNTEIEKLNLSVRSYNCLKRAGLNDVGKVVHAIQEDKLWNVRNLGKMSRAEIHVRIYEFGYNSLSENGKKEFAKNLYELNKDRYLVTESANAK